MMLHSRVTGSVWVMAGTIEAMRKPQASLMRDRHAGIYASYAQLSVAASASLFLDGLVGPKRRKAWVDAGQSDGRPHHCYAAHATLFQRARRIGTSTAGLGGLKK